MPKLDLGGPLNTFELVKAMIEAGAAGIHLEDQLSSLKKCGHLGGKVLEPVHIFIEKLVTARLASDVLDVPTLIIARTDAESASFLRGDSNAVDQLYLTGHRSHEGYFQIKNGIEYAIARSLSFAAYADMLWCETSKPDLGQAREFAQGIHEKYPGKWLAYNCSPSFNWKKPSMTMPWQHSRINLQKWGISFNLSPWQDFIPSMPVCLNWLTSTVRKA